MANWIIGGMIAVLVTSVIVRGIYRIKKGKGSCCGNCGGCSGNCGGTEQR